jgi:oligopeptide/dipeptide ABC transporter ATP-binding protein
MPSLLEVRHLTVDLPTERGWIRPLDDVSFTLDPGESLGIVGESGSGKTMLGLSLIRLLPPAARVTGEILLGPPHHAPSTPPNTPVTNLVKASSRDLRSLRGRDVAMIFQEPMTALNPLMRVGKQIEEAIRIHEPSCSARDAHRRTVEVLARVVVPEPERIASQFPHQLSGGLRQRAMIAMAISAQPRLLIADEPTTALDPTVQKQILELLAQLQRDLGLAMIFISHDLAVVASLAHRIAVMYTGRIIEQGTALQIIRSPSHPYTAGLLRAMPQMHREPLRPIPGSVPPLSDLPPGCTFGPRCEFHQSECDAAVPNPRQAEARHFARCILVPKNAPENATPCP